MNFWKGLGDLSLEVTADGLGGGEDCEEEAGSITEKIYKRGLLYEKPTNSGLHKTA